MEVGTATDAAGKRDAPRSAGGVVSLSTACRPRSVASASSVQHLGPSNGAGAVPVENGRVSSDVGEPHAPAEAVRIAG